MNRIFKRKLVFVKRSVHRSVLCDLQTRKKLKKKKGRPQEPILSPRFTNLRFTSPRFTSPRFTSPHFTSPRFILLVLVLQVRFTNLRFLCERI